MPWQHSTRLPLVGHGATGDAVETTAWYFVLLSWPHNEHYQGCINNYQSKMHTNL